MAIALYRYRVSEADGTLLATGSFKAPHAASVIRHVSNWCPKAGALEVERLFNGTWIPATTNETKGKSHED